MKKYDALFDTRIYSQTTHRGMQLMTMNGPLSLKDTIKVADLLLELVATTGLNLKLHLLDEDDNLLYETATKTETIQERSIANG